MRNKAEFHVEGTVQRKWVGDKVARLTIRVELEHRNPKIDCVAFERPLIEAIERLDDRDEVIVSGDITMTPVRNKKGENLRVDGYERWVPQLVVTAINGEFDEKVAHEEQENGDAGEKPNDNDDIPF